MSRQVFLEMLDQARRAAAALPPPKPSTMQDRVRSVAASARSADDLEDYLWAQQFAPPELWEMAGLDRLRQSLADKMALGQRLGEAAKYGKRFPWRPQPQMLRQEDTDFPLEVLKRFTIRNNLMPTKILRAHGQLPADIDQGLMHRLWAPFVEGEARRIKKELEEAAEPRLLTKLSIPERGVTVLETFNRHGAPYKRVNFNDILRAEWDLPDRDRHAKLLRKLDPKSNNLEGPVSRDLGDVLDSFQEYVQMRNLYYPREPFRGKLYASRGGFSMLDEGTRLPVGRGMNRVLGEAQQGNWLYPGAADQAYPAHHGGGLSEDLTDAVPELWETYMPIPHAFDEGGQITRLAEFDVPEHVQLGEETRGTFKPAYSVRMSPKRPRKDYLLLPILETPEKGPLSRQVIQHYDIPVLEDLAALEPRQSKEMLEQLASDLVKRTRGVSPKKTADVRQYVADRYGINLSLLPFLAALTGGGAWAGSQQPSA